MGKFYIYSRQFHIDPYANDSGQCILRAVGVGGGVAAAGVVETEDLIEFWKRLTERLAVL